MVQFDAIWFKRAELLEKGPRRNKLEAAVKSKKNNTLTSRIYGDYDRETEIGQLLERYKWCLQDHDRFKFTRKLKEVVADNVWWETLQSFCPLPIIKTISLTKTARGLPLTSDIGWTIRELLFSCSQRHTQPSNYLQKEPEAFSYISHPPFKRQGKT